MKHLSDSYNKNYESFGYLQEPAGHKKGKLRFKCILSLSITIQIYYMVMVLLVNVLESVGYH